MGFSGKRRATAEHGHRHLLPLSGPDAGAHRPAQKGRHQRLLPHDLGLLHAPAPGHGPRVPNRNFSSMRDPYFVLRQYHSRFVQPTGEPADMPWRWQNSAYDVLIDQMGQTPTDAPEMAELYRKAMDLWLAEVALHPHRPMAAPHPAQRDLLDQLAQRGKPLYQQRLLEPHLAVGAAEFAAAGVRNIKAMKPIKLMSLLMRELTLHRPPAPRSRRYSIEMPSPMWKQR